MIISFIQIFTEARNEYYKIYNTIFDIPIIYRKPECRQDENVHLNRNERNNDIVHHKLIELKMVSNNNTLELLSWLCSTFLNRSYAATKEEAAKEEETFQPASKNQNATYDNGAVLYIVAVLVFYSGAIVVMIIKYLNSGIDEKNEEAMLEAFFQSMPTGQAEKENQVNQVAIRAFHTLTTATHDDDGSSSPSSSSLITDV